MIEIRKGLVAGLLVALSSSVAAAQDWPQWRVVDGAATIRNDAAAFAVACGAAGTPELRLSAPGAAAIPDDATVLIQVSSQADAYVLAQGTAISTHIRSFTGPGGTDGATYTSADDSGALAGLVEDLRAGLNLIVAVEVFDRSQRFTLAGSRRAIDAALAGCSG